MTKTYHVNRLIDESKWTNYHWIIYFLALLLVTFDGYDLVIFGAAIPKIMVEWNLQPGVTGIIASLALGSAALGATLGSILADKIGRKKVAIAAIFIYSGFTGLSAFCPEAITLGICRVLSGIGVGASMPIAISLIAAYTPASRRVFMIGSAATGMQWGSIVAGVVAILFYEHFHWGWRSLFIVGFFPLLFMPLYYKYFPEMPNTLIAKGDTATIRKLLAWVRPDVHIPQDAIFEADKPAPKVPVTALFQENRGPSTLIIWLLFMLCLYVNYTFQIWLPQLMLSLGFDMTESLSFLISYNLAAWAGIQITSYMGDVYGHKRMIFVCWLIGLAAIIGLGFSQAGSFVLISILIGLVGIGVIGAQSLLNGMATLYYPTAVGATGYGFAYAVGRLGTVCGPIIMGLTMQSANSTASTTILNLAAPAVLSLVAVLGINSKYNNFENEKKKAALAANTKVKFS